MDADPNVNQATELLLRAGARACGRCGTQSLVPAHESGKQLWFCFECGHEEHETPSTVSPISKNFE